MKERKVIYFKLTNAKVPFIDWMAKLKDKRAEAKIDIRIRRATLGNFGDQKGPGDGLIELRIPFGPGYRVYLAIENEETILLLIAGDKSSQKKDVLTAKKYLQEWRSRHEWF